MAITDQYSTAGMNMLTTPSGNTIGSTGNFSGEYGVNYTGAVWGSPIPLSAGFRKISGVVVWAGGLDKSDLKTVTIPAIPGVPSSFSTDYSSWTLKQTFAVALGKRLNPDAPPPQIRRVWADGTLVWANGEGIPLNYQNINQDYMPTGQYVNGVWVPVTGGPGIGTVQDSGGGVPSPLKPIKSNLTFRFHDGNENQLPDEAVIADLGALAPAFRGLMYIVVEGLVVGKGFSTDAHLENLGQAPSLGDTDNQYTLPPMYPQITVELVDGNETTLTQHSFHMLDDAVGFDYGSGTILANHETRELAIVAPHVIGGGGHLNYFDMDSATQTACIPINVGGDQIGTFGGGLACWDKVNDIIYTERTGDHCICSVNRSGAVVSTALELGVNLFPYNVDGSATITNAKPAIGFPRPEHSDVGHVIVAGQLYPVVLAGHFWVAAFAPSPGGVIPNTLRPDQFYEKPGAAIGSVKALNLATDAAKKQHLSYQDICFVVAAADGVELVYVTRSSDNISRVLGRTSIYTAASSSSCKATLDAGGNVVVQEFKLGSPTLFSKIGIDTNGSPDFTVAPGWRGLFPKSTGFIINKAATGEPGVWDGNSIREADVSAGTLAVDNSLVNLADGSLTSIAGFNGQDSLTSVWDSVNKIRYWHGVINAAEDQVFSGRGMHFSQVWSGVNGDVDTVGAYLRMFSHAAGYTDASIDIDSKLTDQVPGVLITHPYDLATLFNDIGAIYEFTYFNSGGKLKFARSSNSPVKATGGWTITGSADPVTALTITVQDGDTATIGSYVYRFKLAPSQPFDVKIATDTVVSPVLTTADAKEKTAANFLAALNADLTLAAADSRDPALAPAFFAGTVKNNLVIAKAASSTSAYGFVSIALTAVVGGSAGNSIALAKTGTHMAFDHATLLNGAEPPEPDLVITRGQLALVQENQISQFDSLVTTIAPFGQGQQAAAVTFYALEQDYVYSQQTFIPDDQNGALDQTGATTVTYNLPFILSTSEAYARVAKTAIREADNVIRQSFRLPQSFLLMEPSDVIAIQLAPFNYVIRVDEATFNGDFSTSFTAVNFTFRSDVPINDSDSTSRYPQTIPSASDGLPVVIDAPLREPVFGTIAGNIDLFDGIRAYVAGFGQGILSAAKYVPDATLQYSQLMSTSKDVKWGTATLPSAVEPFYRTVEDSITVSCKTINPETDLASASYQDFVAGRNCLAVGNPGSWEYIFFRDVQVLNTKTARLTGLVRAQRGTDEAAALHGPSDVVLLVASVAPTFVVGALQPQSLPATEALSTYQYQAKGQPAARAPVTQNILVKGLVLYPFSPCQLKVVLAAGNDINLSWVRRDRLGTEFVTNGQTLSETTERYDLEILSGATVVRTVNGLAVPAYTYTSAQQVTDGFTPPLAALKFRVYQKGELGRGFPRLETLNVS